MSQYQYYVRLMNILDARKLNDKGDTVYLPLKLNADPAVVEIIRYLVWLIKKRGVINSLSGLQMNDVSGLPADLDFLARDISGNLFIDLMNIKISSGRAGDHNRELMLRNVTDEAGRKIISLAIKEFIMQEFRWRLMTDYGKDMTPEKYGVDKPLQISVKTMKLPDGCYTTAFTFDNSVVNLVPENIQPEARIMMTWNEIECVYDILAGKDHKKLMKKYGDLYARLSAKVIDPMEESAISTLIKKIDDIEKESDANLTAEMQLIENFRQARKFALLAKYQKKLKDVLDKAKNLTNGKEGMTRVFQVANELERMKNVSQENIDLFVKHAGDVTAKDFPEITLE